MPGTEKVPWLSDRLRRSASSATRALERRAKREMTLSIRGSAEEGARWGARGKRTAIGLVVPGVDGACVGQAEKGIGFAEPAEEG